MKRYTIAISITLFFGIVLCGACTALLFMYTPALFWIPLSLYVLFVLGAVLISLRFRAVCTGWMLRLCNKLDSKNREMLDKFPLPVLLLDDGGCVLFTNRLFAEHVMEGETTTLDTPLNVLFSGVSFDDISTNATVDLVRKDRRYTAYVTSHRSQAGQQYLLYLTEDTDLKIAAEEYEASRPVVVQICIDNLEEATERLRAGDRARISGAIETMLEDWISADGGILQKYGNERFVAITEHRYLPLMQADQFSILKRVRQSFPEADGEITLSIGVGEGKTVEEGRQTAARALDMALSRGGDQAAVKTDNGFDFYGGRSGGVQHHTRVRTRIIADALRNLILGSDRVLIMGHRMSDLDSLGGSVALAAVARRLQIPAAVVVDTRATMAGQLVDRFTEAGHADWFVHPDHAQKWITPNSLLIIVDTHSAGLLESVSLYNAAERVVVIDHHRRRVDFIENTLLSYHESTSSSACELIAEMLPYLMKESIDRIAAEALLAGIMLDTRNFVLRTGVRTFEAAAYLRGLGADTVTVKKMFNESLEIYRLKSELVANAQVYQTAAIAMTEDDFSAYRVAAAQAADDLLSVQGVKASFVVCRISGDVYISARSFGECNVQLIMESLGGGGHLTMAATQLSDCTVDMAVDRLKKAIDHYFEQIH